LAESGRATEVIPLAILTKELIIVAARLCLIKQITHYIPFHLPCRSNFNQLLSRILAGRNFTFMLTCMRNCA